MMARYIDEGALKRALERGGDFTVADLLDILEDIPTTDVAEARHGEWKMRRYPLTQCYACGAVRDCEKEVGWNYCPHCGAKMDGERREK